MIFPLLEGDKNIEAFDPTFTVAAQCLIYTDFGTSNFNFNCNYSQTFGLISLGFIRI